MALVRRSRRLGLERQVLVAISGSRLEQGLNGCLVLLVHPVGLDQLREDSGQVLELIPVALLQKARLPALQHNNCALKPVNGLHHFLFRAVESRLLFLSELRCVGKLRFGGRDLAGELLDLRAELADASRGVRDLCLEVANLGSKELFELLNLRFKLFQSFELFQKFFLNF